MSQNSMLHPVSRLSFRTVVGGVLVTIAVFLSLLALVAAFSDWTFDLRELPPDNPGFWISVFAAWVVSVFAGGVAASWSMAPMSTLNGILNSVVTWAAACMFVTTILTVSTNETFNFARNFPSLRGPFWIVFVGNAIALGAAVLAGLSGRKSRSRVIEVTKKGVDSPLTRVDSRLRGASSS